MRASERKVQGLYPRFPVIFQANHLLGIAR
jgi:hypothetical protein